MTAKLIPIIDPTDRDDGDAIVWDAGDSIHKYLPIASNPMTAAGDIIKGGTGGAPERLAIGAAGGALSVIDGALAYNSGTSFPGTPDAGDRFWRTDLGMEFYYDGTRWLTTTIYTADLGAWSTTAATFTGTMVVFDEAGLDVWAIECVFGSAIISDTHDVSNHYNLRCFKSAADGSAGTGSDIASVTSHTLGTGLNNFASAAVAIGAVIDVSAHPGVIFIANEVGATGSARLFATLRYRFIAT